jgi:hypothetical protein
VCISNRHHVSITNNFNMPNMPNASNNAVVRTSKVKIPAVPWDRDPEWTEAMIAIRNNARGVIPWLEEAEEEEECDGQA